MQKQSESNNQRIIAVTGASGFIGRHVCERLLADGFTIRPINRRQVGVSNEVIVGDVGPFTDWSNCIEGVDCIIHTIAHVHLSTQSQPNSSDEYFAVNAEGTKRLAEQAITNNVRRLIFLSTVGVLGSTTDNRTPFNAASSPAPVNAYSISKYMAEQMLCELGRKTGLEVVIIRPPLVYGPGAPGNFSRLVRLIDRGLPLPFGLLGNQRSFVGIDNLVDLILNCIDSSASSGRSLLVSDNNDASTAQFVRAIAEAMNKRIFLIPVPKSILRAIGSILGMSREIDQLTGSLEIDISETCQILGWTPPYKFGDCITRAVDGVDPGFAANTKLNQSVP